MRRGCRSCRGPLYGSSSRARTMADPSAFANAAAARSPRPEQTAAMPVLPRVTLVTLEATIGAGKSTQLRLLKEAFQNNDSVVFLDEPDAEWEEHGLINALYSGDIDKCAFQMMALISRVTDLINLVLSGARFIVSERSPLSDYLVFANANLNGIDLCGYEYCFRKLQALLEKHAVFNVHMVYLNVCCDVAKERIASRGRRGESQDGIPDRYLRILEDAHVDMAKLALSNAAAARCRGAPESSLSRLTTRCSVLDGHVDLQTIHAQLVDIIREELSSLPSTSFESKTLDRLTLSNMDCNGVVA